MTSSCSRKTVDITKTSNTTLDSSVSSTNEKIKIVDQSTTTTIEEVDTTVRTESDTAKTSVTIDPNSNESVESESQSNGVKVKLKYDPKTKKVEATAIKEAEDIKVKSKKTTIEKKDVATESERQKDSIAVNKTEQTTYQKKKDRKGLSLGGWLFIVGGGIVLILIGIIFVPGVGGKFILLFRKIFGK